MTREAVAPAKVAGTWRVRGQSLDLGPVPRLMGIVNVTPDSFSDGGFHATADEAILYGVEMWEAGADILDVGGESTRPGARPVSEDEECGRSIPVVRGLAERTDALISIDTTKTGVAREALSAGAHIVNDVSALRFSPRLAEVVAGEGAGLVVMHMLGEPRTMQDDPRYDDLFGEIREALRSAATAAESAGVEPEAIVIDPGIGFGKTAEDNYRLVAGLNRFHDLGYPVLLGHSRKTFLDPEKRREPGSRLTESLTAGLLGALNGAAILRVHDVREHVRMLTVYERFMEATS